MFFYQILDFKCGLSHFHTQRFRFVASGNGAAVVVTEHNYRPADERRIENPLAGGIEIITVDMCKRWHYKCFLKLQVMMPKIRFFDSSVISMGGNSLLDDSR